MPVCYLGRSGGANGCGTAQWFMAFTCIIMVLLAFLGFTNFSRALPLNDKLLHFFCFGIATAVFYFIVDVEEYALFAQYLYERLTLT